MKIHMGREADSGVGYNSANVLSCRRHAFPLTKRAEKTTMESRLRGHEDVMI